MPVFQTRLCPTLRGAIFRTRRWFYGTYAKTSNEDVRSRNIEKWRKLAELLVNVSNERNLSDKAGRIIIEYNEIVNLDGSKEFDPVRVKIEIYEKLDEIVLNLKESSEI